jgi:hypothetical protein
VNTEESSHSQTLDLLDRLKPAVPEVCGQPLVVGRWDWLEFNIAPVEPVRAKSRELAFHWNPVHVCPSERSSCAN